mmetsp:Transcript_50637/g.127561  ORF Transcript_50637/g.127561 Transcript_50637/m.127561 type:complete len:316 (-) Transcript_50637:730-1677(-)
MTPLITPAPRVDSAPQVGGPRWPGAPRRELELCGRLVDGIDAPGSTLAEDEERGSHHHCVPVVIIQPDARDALQGAEGVGGGVEHGHGKTAVAEAKGLAAQGDAIIPPIRWRLLPLDRKLAAPLGIHVDYQSHRALAVDAGVGECDDLAPYGRRRSVVHLHRGHALRRQPCNVRSGIDDDPFVFPYSGRHEDIVPIHHEPPRSACALVARNLAPRPVVHVNSQDGYASLARKAVDRPAHQQGFAIFVGPTIVVVRELLPRARTGVNRDDIGRIPRESVCDAIDDLAVPRVFRSAGTEAGSERRPCTGWEVDDLDV